MKNTSAKCMMMMMMMMMTMMMMMMSDGTVYITESYCISDRFKRHIRCSW